MMVLVDYRKGSVELEPYLRKVGVEVEVVDLEYADVAFMGTGPREEGVAIGVERKTVRDLLNCMESERFSKHQLPGLLDQYEYQYLLVEGMWKVGRTGELLLYKGREWKAIPRGKAVYAAQTLVAYMNSIQVMTPLKVVQSRDLRETASLVKYLALWWGKRWEAHKSMRPVRSKVQGTVQLLRPSMVRAVAYQVPGIGWERSGDVARKFGNVLDMAAAGREEWMEVDGIGPVTAESAVRALQREQ